MLSALLLACFGCCCSIAHIQQHLNLLDRHAAAQCNGEPLFLVHVISRKIPDWPSREPIRIGSHLKLTTSAIMYHSTSLFLPDPAWKSRKSATVSMLSPTGRPRGYAECDGSLSEWQFFPDRRSGARFQLLSFIFSSTLCVLNITLLLSANNGDLCEFCRWKKIEEQRKKTTMRKKRPASDSGCRPILKVWDHFELFPRERVEERLALRVEAEDAAVGFSSRFPIQQPVSLEKLP